MKFQASIDVMPHKVILDPQGKAVLSGLKNLGLNKMDNVRVGKHITLEVEADSKAEAEEKTTEACEKLLANKIMEYYEFEVTELQEA
ncbi:phosphoribosylformylglycinamidine synthase subunit PurS [Salibacter halophilus]|jgi:phosphoribosylformylglycinamidine synthase|uniref:Phosphoribosylformylglycinamidine synthase subunit PurS n=1 Tax=Salibacter halophilus TaxID=1803916 RepID=A0A6N6M2D8_9FLAO|nr:phosphoribosylformylglycinamidine synthase subunit PurS [Salibacter halophilus]KAB1063352.1 phosphoribosylformylglycinamidine synthase subunit PurS [Salibacter halophilus]